MEDYFILGVLLAIGCFVSGPIALIIVLNLSSKVKSLTRRLDSKDSSTEQVWLADVEQVEEEPHTEPKEQIVPAVTIQRESAQEIKPEPILQLAVATKKTDILLEQKIGTKWILIAGVITVFVGIGFFLKYAYENFSLSPLQRIIIVAIAGLIALTSGEITRRRGYDVVAKGVTALGFAILYAAIFTAYQLYGLIDSKLAYSLAIIVTAGAMFYAVILDEILIAFLSLLGGFVTPLIISTGQNLPIPLFSYTLILSVGAMLCAYRKKWRAVNFLAFVGTYFLYIAWFEKFYRPQIIPGTVAEQMPIAITVLVVFFFIYIAMPILYELINRVNAHKEDVLLVVANAFLIFYFLWTILYQHHRTALTLCTVALSAIHLAMMLLVSKRCKDDVNLRTVFLAIGLCFITIAVPVYLKMYALTLAWSAEAVILTLIGLRYHSKLTQVSGAIALFLSCCSLIYNRPLHNGQFALVLNPEFGSWCFVAAAAYFCHLLYRRTSELTPDNRRTAAQAFYVVMGILLFTAATMEWFLHCQPDRLSEPLFLKGQVLIFTVTMLLFIVRPICPRGIVSLVTAAITAGIGAMFTVIAFTNFYNDSFIIFTNTGFGIALLFVIALLTAAWLLAKGQQNTQGFATAFALGAVFILWILLAEQIYLYWYYRDRFAEDLPNWQFLAHMYISVMWALYAAILMIIGFYRKIRILRYIAIALLGLLLIKVFILDTRNIENVYRIAAFLATGVTLVGISYLYQFLRKKGFFDSLLTEKTESRP
ncbi:DUF2339 domain-containing protein [Planctomycetota bacterium]